MKRGVWHGDIDVVCDVLAGREMRLRARCRMEMNSHRFPWFNFVGPDRNPVLPKLCAPVPRENNRFTRLQRQQGEALVRKVYGLDSAVEAQPVDRSGVGAMTCAAGPKQTRERENQSDKQQVSLGVFHFLPCFSLLQRTSRSTSRPLSLR